MRFVVIICLGVILFSAFGCASTKTFVLLRHPVTNKVVECPGETGVGTGSAAEMKACVEPYLKDGYEIISSY